MTSATVRTMSRGASHRLLLHSVEIRKLQSKVSERGWTIVPLSMYLSGGRAKAKLALVRGKRLYDKKDAETCERDADREMQRVTKGGWQEDLLEVRWGLDLLKARRGAKVTKYTGGPGSETWPARCLWLSWPGRAISRHDLHPSRPSNGPPTSSCRRARLPCRRPGSRSA